MKHKIIQASAVLLILILMAGIRAVGTEIFYDPLIAYFKGDFQKAPLPDLELFKYSIHLFLRFALNSLLTLALIWIIFRNKQHIQFTGLALLALGTLLCVGFVILYPNASNSNYQSIFYIRRILIHPVLMFIFIPSLYFLDQKTNT